LKGGKKRKKKKKGRVPIIALPSTPWRATANVPVRGHGWRKEGKGEKKKKRKQMVFTYLLDRSGGIAHISATGEADKGGGGKKKKKKEKGKRTEDIKSSTSNLVVTLRHCPPRILNLGGE